MTLDRVLAVLSMIALACVGGTGVARTIALARAGVWVLPIDRERSLSEALADLAAVVGMAAFVWEAIATAVAPGWRILDLPRLAPDLPWATLRVLGVPAAAVAVALYVLALRAFGPSWRFTIDRERPGVRVSALLRRAGPARGGLPHPPLRPGLRRVPRARTALVRAVGTTTPLSPWVVTPEASCSALQRRSTCPPTGIISTPGPSPRRGAGRPWPPESRAG